MAVLIVGGWAREGTTALAEAEMFEPTSGTFRPAGTLQGGATPLPDGRVLIAHGGDGPTDVTAAVQIFDPATGSLTPGPTMPLPRHSASIVLPDGHILITGGQDGPRHGLSSTVIYDPASGDRRPGPGDGHAAIQARDHHAG